MTSTDLLTILIAVAIGTPLGIGLAGLLGRALDFIEDLVYDIRRKIARRKIRSRRK